MLDKTTCSSFIEKTKTRDTWVSCMPKRSAKSLFSFTSTMNISSNGHSFLFWPHFVPETESLSAFTDPQYSYCLAQHNAARKSSEPCMSKTLSRIWYHHHNPPIVTAGICQASAVMTVSPTVPCSLSAAWWLQARGVSQQWCQWCQTPAKSLYLSADAVDGLPWAHVCSHSTVSSATSETNVNINDLCYIIIFLVSSATSEKKLNVNDLLYNNFLETGYIVHVINITK